VLSIAVGDPTRVVLLAVIVLLAAILVGLVALLVAIRRRPPVAEPVPEPAAPLRPPMLQASPPPRPSGARSAPREIARASASAGGGLQVAASGMVCPTCRTEYAGMTYCQRDARRLVAAEEILAGGRGPGGVCVSCRRAFDPGLRKCPHDGAEVIPAPLYWATRGRRDRDAAPTGVEAKICPACRRRYDLSARFCGRDGAELVVVN
jgi:hypothetical protein